MPLERRPQRNAAATSEVAGAIISTRVIGTRPPELRALIHNKKESGSLAAPRFITLLLAFGASNSAGRGRCRSPHRKSGVLSGVSL